ncbi:MAG: excinuclease ABC subunit UvrC, partial [Bacteroidota bacterium]
RPGVYLMKDREGKVIYVGKAVSLRRRARSYFQRGRHAGTKVEHMARQVAGIEWIVTDSEAEALILESNLIKLHRPWYNVKLRDDKAYPYLKVTVNETYPRIMVVRRPRSDGARYFGPYTNSTAVRETLQFLRKLFPVRTCQLDIDKGQRLRRPCLLYHIGRCPGPCVDGLTTPAEYRQIIDEVCLFLEGRQEKLVGELRQRMREASARLDFERAARLRDVLQAIERVVERQKVISTRLGDVDVIGLAHDSRYALACIAVLFVRDGKLVGRETFFLDTADSMVDASTVAATGSTVDGTGTAFARVQGLAAEPGEAGDGESIERDPELAGARGAGPGDGKDEGTAGAQGRGERQPAGVDQVTGQDQGIDETQSIDEAQGVYQGESDGDGQDRQAMAEDQAGEQEILEAFLSSYYAEAGFIPDEIWLPRALRHDQEQLLLGWLNSRRHELLQAAPEADADLDRVPTVARSSPDYTPEEGDARRASRRAAAGRTARQVRLSAPQRGERGGLVRLARENAAEVLQEHLQAASRREAANQAGMEELARVLGLPGLPWRIECYDISNFHEREPVAAMVVLEGGEPANKEYRKFKMRTPGPNDFAMMAEVIERRFRHGLAERAELKGQGLLHTVEKRPPTWLPAEEGERGEPVVGSRKSARASAKGKSKDKTPASRFARLPDLVVIDGGQGQLGAAVEVLRNLGLGDLPVIGLAKENEWIFTPDDTEPIVLPHHSPALHLLQRVRDEAHRFGITFHRKLRGERTLASALDDVPGIGPARKKALLRAFGSVAGVRRASVEELAAVPGISRSLAEQIHEYLGKN